MKYRLDTRLGLQFIWWIIIHHTIIYKSWKPSEHTLHQDVKPHRVSTITLVENLAYACFIWIEEKRINWLVWWIQEHHIYFYLLLSVGQVSWLLTNSHVQTYLTWQSYKALWTYESCELRAPQINTAVYGKNAHHMSPCTDTSKANYFTWTSYQNKVEKRDRTAWHP